MPGTRKSSEPKIRPYIRRSIVDSSRRRFPEFEGSDADFIEWLLSSVGVGMMGFYGQITPKVETQKIVEVPVQRRAEKPSEPKREEPQEIDLLDEEAD